MVIQLDAPPARTSSSDRPAVLLLHGFFSNRNSWQHVAAHLEPDVRPIFPDLLGYGAAGHAPGYTLDHLVDHLLPIIERENPTHLVGHSMGAIVALALAARLPGQFERVGIIGLPVFHDQADGRAHFYGRSPFYRVFLRVDPVTHIACQAMHHTRHLWRPTLRFIAPPASRPVYESVFDHCRSSHDHGLNRIVFGGHIPTLAPSVSSPVTLLHGARDKAAPPDRAHALAETHGWEFELAARHGHQAILIHPHFVADWVRRSVIGAPVAAR
jgi:pimeloyl-ACP methyl ester carboxylesterase